MLLSIKDMPNLLWKNLQWTLNVAITCSSIVLTVPDKLIHIFWGNLSSLTYPLYILSKSHQVLISNSDRHQRKGGPWWNRRQRPFSVTDGSGLSLVLNSKAWNPSPEERIMPAGLPKEAWGKDQILSTILSTLCKSITKGFWGFVAVKLKMTLNFELIYQQKMVPLRLVRA